MLLLLFSLKQRQAGYIIIKISSMFKKLSRASFHNDIFCLRLAISLTIYSLNTDIFLKISVVNDRPVYKKR